MMHGRKKSDFASVIDRVVQQALVQKMTPIFEPLFAKLLDRISPGRSPHIMPFGAASNSNRNCSSASP